VQLQTSGDAGPCRFPRDPEATNDGTVECESLDAPSRPFALLQTFESQTFEPKPTSESKLTFELPNCNSSKPLFAAVH
jgi:hypothetical protein